jgi:hypothetical protein
MDPLLAAPKAVTISERLIDYNGFNIQAKPRASPLGSTRQVLMDPISKNLLGPNGFNIQESARS